MFPAWVTTVIWVSLLIFGVFIFGILVFYIGWRIRDYKRYKDYFVMIFNEDEWGQKDVKFDQGGIFVDKKTNNKKFFLRYTGVGMDFENLVYSHGNNGKKIVMLSKKKDSEYQYVKPEFKAKQGIEFSMGEEDLNWGLNSYEKAKTAYEWRNKLLQFAPWMGLIFVGFVFLILCIYVLKQFDVLAQLGTSMEKTATILSQNSGVVVQ